MEIQSLIHEHDLTPCDDVDNRECYCCRRVFSGLGYLCSEGEERYFCNSCYHLPTEVRHHLHPQHVLKLILDLDTDYDTNDYSTSNSRSNNYFFCDGCKTTRFGFSYRCGHGDCKFILHIKCTFSNLKHDYSRRVIKPALHYSHVHELVNTKCHKYRFECGVCEQRMCESRGSCYGCYDCAFFVHEDCLRTPQVRHPVHSHPLRLPSFYESLGESVKCQACCEYTYGPFLCGECDFNLHVHCAESLLHTLRHDSHPHPLWYLSKNILKGGLFPCYLCSATDCGEEGSFYRCVQCNLNFHIECLNLPQTVKHKNHMHSLALVNQVLDEVCYCDVCELQKDPENHAYYCEECSFVAHIECILSKENLSWKMFNLAAHVADTESDEEEASTTKMISHEKQHETSSIHISIGNEPQKIKVTHIHQHVLFLNEVIQASERLDCNVCDQEILHFGYTCKRCKFWMHKSCSKLPKDVVHQIHPDHSLTLLPKFPFRDLGRNFLCCKCRVRSKGMCFYCRICGFVLDTNCASLVEDAIFDYHHDQRLKKENKKISITHLGVTLQLAVLLEKHNEFCSICYRKIVGPCYSHKYFETYYHESCLEGPVKIQHILHPQHSMFRERYMAKFVCGACQIESFLLSTEVYNCQECRFTLHTGCAISIQRSLNHMSCHEHSLYIFLTNDNGILIFHHDITFNCTICGEMCVGYFYRCVDCQVSFHIGCLPLPRILKHKLVYERHPLILEDKFVEDDSGEYYCDICEHPRDGEHPVYCCKECTYFAHIECIISKELFTSGENIFAELLSDSAKEDDGKGHGDADKDILSSNRATPMVMSIQVHDGDEAKDEYKEAYDGDANDDADIGIVSTQYADEGGQVDEVGEGYGNADDDDENENENGMPTSDVIIKRKTDVN